MLDMAWQLEGTYAKSLPMLGWVGKRNVEGSVCSCAAHGCNNSSVAAMLSSCCDAKKGCCLRCLFSDDLRWSRVGI